MSPRSSALLLVVVLTAVGSVGGCGTEEGVTPKTCPELPLYDVNDPSYKSDPDIQAKLAEAEAAGCATPIGTAVSGTLDSGAPQVQAGAGGQNSGSPGTGGSI